MILTGAIAMGSALILRSATHALILRGLRAPRQAHLRTPFEMGFNARAVSLPTAGGTSLFAWFVAQPDKAPAPAVVVMHGWGANASLMLPALAPLHAAGFSVLLIDARCHGRSDGAAFTSLPRFTEDIEAGLDWLRQQDTVDSQRLAVMGHSVGAGAALLAATRRADVRAVISLSAFAHPREIMRTFLAQSHIPYPVVGWYIMRHVQAVIGARFDDIAPLVSMTLLRCPVLLVHGRDDELVPFSDAQRLQSACTSGRARCLRIAGGHDPSSALEAHLPELVSFLQQAVSEATIAAEELLPANDEHLLRKPCDN